MRRKCAGSAAPKSGWPYHRGHGHLNGAAASPKAGANSRDRGRYQGPLGAITYAVNAATVLVFLILARLS